MKLSIEEIMKLSYTDFVGFINQWNVLPGAYSTLSKWRVFSQINEHSKVLEVACTTGFSLREIAKMTHCSGKGIDISERSVIAAKKNKERYAPNTNITYEVADGYEFTSQEKFTHIIAGASLKFFPDPKKMVDKCLSLLQDEGYLLVSPFYIEDTIPSVLIEEFKKIFDITPTTTSYKEIMTLYKGFEILFEEHNNLIAETDEELTHYCKSTIDRACSEKNITDKKVYQVMYDRLLQIKAMSNKLRKYQRYVVLVLRYNSKIYPNRYVELF